MSIEFEEITTSRLILRKLTPQVFTDIFKKCTDQEIKTYLGLLNDEELSKERRKSELGYETYDRSIVAFLLVLKNNHETIGRCGFHNWYADHQKAEIGYMLNKEEHKRQGYMTEAVEAIIHYGFHAMNLNRIEACIGPTNIASQCIIKKFGFTQEGYLRQHYHRDGEVQDSLIFSLLKEEYNLQKL